LELGTVRAVDIQQKMRDALGYVIDRWDELDEVALVVVNSESMNNESMYDGRWSNHLVEPVIEVCRALWPLEGATARQVG
jgi:hypothetical protein